MTSRRTLLAGLAALLGCCGGRTASDVPLHASVRFEGARRHLTTGALRDPSAADCGRCHEAIAREWEASLHRRASTNAIFEAAYAVEPHPSCRHCHAPRQLPSRGVDCETCHVRDGWVIGARRRSGSPHRGPVDPTMSGVEACEGCHEFDFPEDVDFGLPPSYAPMQSTAREWALEALDEECQDCHMPARDGHADHRFLGREDPARLRGALEVGAERGDGTLTVTVAAVRVGHAVPTGDVFRQLRLRVHSDGEVLTERWFGRTFAEDAVVTDRGAFRVRREVSDTRLRPGAPARVEVPLAAEASATVTVDYLLMPERVAEANGVAPSDNVIPLVTLRRGPREAPGGD